MGGDQRRGAGIRHGRGGAHARDRRRRPPSRGGRRWHEPQRLRSRSRLQPDGRAPPPRAGTHEHPTRRPVRVPHAAALAARIRARRPLVPGGGARRRHAGRAGRRPSGGHRRRGARHARALLSQSHADQLGPAARRPRVAAADGRRASRGAAGRDLPRELADRRAGSRPDAAGAPARRLPRGARALRRSGARLRRCGRCALPRRAASQRARTRGRGQRHRRRAARARGGVNARWGRGVCRRRCGSAGRDVRHRRSRTAGRSRRPRPRTRRPRRR